MAVQKLFDISTAHLSADSRAWLSENATLNHGAAYHGVGDGAALSTLGQLRCGWFLHAPDNAEDYEMPADLVKIVKHARAEDCYYILIDAEAPLLEGFPILDEDLDPEDFTLPGDDEGDTLTCDACGSEYDEGGDGYDGKCPDCADKEFNCDDGQDDCVFDPESPEGRAVADGRLNSDGSEADPQAAWRDTAKAEGWGFYDGSEGTFLMKSDNAATAAFKTDSDACEFVFSQAKLGCIPHKAALEYLWKVNPHQYNDFAERF